MGRQGVEFLRGSNNVFWYIRLNVRFCQPVSALEDEAKDQVAINCQITGLQSENVSGTAKIKQSQLIGYSVIFFLKKCSYQGQIRHFLKCVWWFQKIMIFMLDQTFIRSIESIFRALLKHREGPILRKMFLKCFAPQTCFR